MANEDYVEDPWGAPAHMGSALVANAVFTKAPHSRPEKPKARRLTSGTVRPGSKMFVYVAGVDGEVKIGITSNPAQRSRAIRAAMVEMIPVYWAAAREVEGVALGYLGRSHLQPTEWVTTDVATAIAALKRAWDAVGRYAHVDPALSPEEARQHRIRRALANAA